MALLNYTTKISPEQTISELQQMLAKHGVNAMMTEYDDAQVSAVSFRMKIGDEQRGFKLPCNWRAVYEILKPKNQRSIWDKARAAKIEEERKAQSIRTAWRIIHTWVKAQLALVEVNMVTVPQIFLPYAIMKDGRTLSEHVETDPNFLLGGGQ
jgi:hypothetical protein